MTHTAIAPSALRLTCTGHGSIAHHRADITCHGPMFSDMAMAAGSTPLPAALSVFSLSPLPAPPHSGSRARANRPPRALGFEMRPLFFIAPN